MKKLLLGKLFLLCALIMGSTCVWAETYVKITSASDLVSGDVYIIATNNMIAVSYKSNVLNTTSTGFTELEGTITTTIATPMEFTLGKNGDNYTLRMSDDNYLGYGSNTYFRNSQSNANNQQEQWTIAYNDIHAMYTIVNVKTTDRHIGKGQDVFKPYADMGNNPPATLYRKVAYPSSAATFANATPTIDLATTTTYTQPASTADGYNGTVTYEITENTAGATIDATTFTVTATHEGTVTVKATAAAVENKFQESSASYTLTVTDSRASAPISFSVTSAEAIMGETFTAPVLTNSESLTVSYSSSNEAVATVNATTGAVTLVAPGTTNIIATFAGNTTYKYTTAQYTLTVNKGAQSLPYEESFNKTFGEFTSDGNDFDNITVWTSPEGFVRATSSINNVNKDLDSWLTSPIINAKNEDHIALTFDQAIDSYFGTVADEAVVYAKRVGDADWTKLTITYPAPSENSNPVFQTTTVDLSAFAGNNIQIAFYYKGTVQHAGTWRIKNVKVAVSAEDVIVTGHDLRTFVSDNALDFTDVENLEAYIAKEEDGNVKLYQVRKVPAATGVLLRAKNGATNFVVSFATATDDVSGNIFLRGTGSAVENGTGPYNWILSTKDGVLGFYPASGRTVAADHAYLQTTVQEARIDLTFGDDATAITTVSSPSAQPAAAVYDLQGRRVAQPARGLYIVNGRKVTVK